MNRLQKKCLVGSAGLHLLLLLLLFVGPAFLPSSSRLDLPVLDFIPVKTVDALVSGGGNPKAALPPAAVTPAPQPPAPQPVAPAPEPPKEKAVEPDKPEPAQERKRRIEVSTKMVTRRSEESLEVNPAATRRAQEGAEARRQAAAAIERAVAGIQGGLSGSTTVELKGPGGGGLPYANWLQAVRTVYQRAWVVPQGISDDSAAATVSVTIARDGTVLSAHMIKPSGNAAVDASVEATLNRVKYAAPLPDDAKEDQRTVTIVFDVKSKLLG
jgi:TonB family protein